MNRAEEATVADVNGKTVLNFSGRPRIITGH